MWYPINSQIISCSSFFKQSRTISSHKSLCTVSVMSSERSKKNKNIYIIKVTFHFYLVWFLIAINNKWINVKLKRIKGNEVFILLFSNVTPFSYSKCRNHLTRILCTVIAFYQNIEKKKQKNHLPFQIFVRCSSILRL